MSVYLPESGGGGGAPGSLYLPAASGNKIVSGAGGGSPPTHGSGGFLGGVGHFFAQGGSDLYHAAVNAPTGAYLVAKTAGDAELARAEYALGQTSKASVQRRVAKANALGNEFLKSTVQGFQHPLRHPGYIALTLLPVASGAAKAGEAIAALKAGTPAAEVAKGLVTQAPPSARKLRVNGLTVELPASRSALGRVGQKGIDKTLQASAGRKPGGLGSALLAKRAGKAVTAQAKTAETSWRGQSAALAALGKHLTPGEQKALQVVAEQAPLYGRILATLTRIGPASGRELRGHTTELKLLQDARQHLDETGPLPRLAEPRLQRIYQTMEAVAGGREELAKRLGLLSDEAAQGRRTTAGRAALGATFQEQVLPASHDNLEVGTTVRVIGQKATGKVAEAAGGNALVYYPRFGRSMRLPISALELPSKAKIVGQEQFSADANAVRIPDAARRGARSLGGPGKTGIGGIVGKPKPPPSLTHEYTGGLREKGLRRQDTTRLVAESSAELARFAALEHVVGLAKQAATATPSRNSDLAIRLDGLGASERLPLSVRQYLDDPEGFLAGANPVEQARLLDQVRGKLIFNRDKQGAVKGLAPEDAAEFQRLHAEGKIGFVPKGLLGDFARAQAPLRAVTGSKATTLWDATNNASRLAILYLKPAYAIPNLLGNTALNVLQQGFAAPAYLARAVRLNARLGPELTARIDAHVGEGVAQSIAAHGQGPLAGTVDKAASVWSAGVDRFPRRAAFLYEAARAGYKTPAQLERLLTHPDAEGELARVAAEANREIIDYANLSPVEREVVRRVIFFYPWVKGATLYSGRVLREHPVKAAAAGQLGEQGHAWSAQQLGAVPSTLEGLIPYGKTQTINPAAAAIFQTPAQIGLTIAGLATGNIPQAGQVAQSITPALNLVLAEALRKNLAGGYGYKGGTNFGRVAYDTLVGQTPQASLYRNITQARRHQGQNRIFPPTVRSALTQFLVGGVAPRPTNVAELHARAAKERTQMRTGR